MKPAGNQTVIALVLIGLGTLFLLNGFSGINIGNWWVLFLAIPLVGAAGRVGRDLRAHGHLTGAGFGALMAVLW